MKIRIKGNSVRFRLTKTEVDTFAKTGIYEEQTYFGNKVFTYRLQTKDSISKLYADFVNDTITIYFPSSQSMSWAAGNKVGFSNDIDWNDDRALSLLVEKDFTCLDNTIEDQSDNYPNPKL